jgi:protein tyrosine phosphatase (PTP) superfamily phosphohydrolase (DUF442 family)
VEHNALGDLGFTVQRLPVAGANDVNQERAGELARALEQSEGRVFLHCGSSNRVGALLALKARFIDGQTAEAALAAGKTAGLTGLEPLVQQLLSE